MVDLSESLSTQRCSLVLAAILPGGTVIGNQVGGWRGGWVYLGVYAFMAFKMALSTVIITLPSLFWGRRLNGPCHRASGYEAV